MNSSVSIQVSWIQFAIGFGELDHAILLDTNTLKYEMVPVKLDGYAIVIMNTNKRRGIGRFKIQ